MQRPLLPVIDLGRMSYERARREQEAMVERVLGARRGGDRAPGLVGALFLVEHDPVITISRRPGAASHLLGSPDTLRRAGVDVVQTDRGGDITYHGPGQVVAYPILDLNLLHLRLDDYLRLLEQSAIDACEASGVRAGRDPGCTGAWTLDASGAPVAKIAAIGLRVRRWITLHGLALNVRPEMSHFDLIVPCGLAGRAVTSLERELRDRCPSVAQVRDVLAGAIVGHVTARARAGAPGR
jgi:lipoyl(octanoyl) transferase